MTFSRSGLMVKQFQMASMRLPFSSASLALQSIGLKVTSMPARLQASLARSMSKPTISFFSLRKPMGAKLSSRPITIFFGPLLPQPTTISIIIIENNTKQIFFTVKPLPFILVCSLYFILLNL